MKNFLLLLCLFEYSYAMELAPLLSDKKANYTVSDNGMLLRHIVSLPVEIQGNIVEKVKGYYGEKKYQIQIKLAYKFDHEILQLEPYCPYNLGNKQLTAFDLWRVPDEERKKLIDRLKPSILRDTNVFTQQEQDEIIDMLPDDVQQGLSIHVLRQDCGSYATRCVPLGIGGFMFGTGLALGIIDVVESSSVILKVLSCTLCIGGPAVGFVMSKCTFVDKIFSTKVEYK